MKKITLLLLTSSISLFSFGQRVLKTTNDISLDDICREEGMAMSGFSNTSGLTLTSVGQNIATIYFDQNSSYPVLSNFFPAIKHITFLSNRAITLGIRVDNTASNAFRGANDNITPNGYTRINTQIALQANVRYTLNHPLLQFGFTSPVTLVLMGYDNTDSTPLTLNVEYAGYSITKNTDITADKVLLWIGDSISYGTGSGSFEAGTQEPFAQQVKKSIIERGYRFRLINKSQSSMTTSSIVQAIKWGYYNVRQADFICIMIGANDANNLGSGGLSSSTNQTIFQNNIDYIITYFNKRFPNAKILMLGSTPSSDNTTEARIATSRTIMQARVTAYANNNVKYVNLGSSFDRTNSANYLSADTIHPTAQNSIASAIITGINSLLWFQ